MYRLTLAAHGTRERVPTPSWGALLVSMAAAIFVPLSITVLISVPDVGVGILVGAVLPYLVRKGRSFGRQLLQQDSNVGLRALTPDRIPADAENASGGGR